MTKALDDMFAARLEEIARAAADAITEAIGDSSAGQVTSLRQFEAARCRLPANDLYHLLRTAAHLHGRQDPELGKRLLRYSRDIQQMR